MREAAFITRLYTEVVDDQHDRLIRPLVFYSAVLDLDIKVPRGFVTDYASVPRVPIAYWLNGGTAKYPAVIHDYLYQKKDFPRADADRVFLEAMQVNGQPAWRRYAMYLGVRVFGGTPYRNDQGIQ